MCILLLGVLLRVSEIARYGFWRIYCRFHESMEVGRERAGLTSTGVLHAKTYAKLRGGLERI
jgi:hypothetical protein